MDKKKIIYKIIEIICTAIISIAAVLTAQSCTMSLSVSKNNSNSTQKLNKQQLAQLIVHKSISTFETITLFTGVNIDGRSFSDFDRSINSLIFTLPLTTRAIKK